jgi:hypothetical protein
MRFAGSLNAVTQQTESASKLLNDAGVVQSAQFVLDDATMWHSLAALPLRFAEGLSWRVGLRPADVPVFLRLLDKTYSTNERCEPMWQVSVGDGRIRILDRPMRNGDQAIVRLESMRTEAQNLGSSLMLENAPAEMRDRVEAWGNLGPSAPLMQGLKQQLDPNNIFSPGRFGF